MTNCNQGKVQGYYEYTDNNIFYIPSDTHDKHRLSNLTETTKSCFPVHGQQTTLWHFLILGSLTLPILKVSTITSFYQVYQSFITVPMPIKAQATKE